MNHIRLIVEELSVDEARKLVTDPRAGAISMFIGTTRNNCDGKQVQQLDYEAYLPMAEKEIQKICEQIRQKWDVLHICVMHRYGTVPLMEASVIIAISSAHRQPSLEAVQYCINSLKASVPIWKKEVYVDGCGEWMQNKECSWKSTDDPCFSRPATNHSDR